MQAFYKIPPNSTVSDLVMLVYGTLDFTMRLITDNPWIENANFDLTKYAGQPVVYDDELAEITPVNLKTTPPPVAVQRIYRVQQGQSLADVCMQVYGGLEYMMQLVIDNGLPDVNISPDDLLGKNLIFNQSLTRNPAVFNHNKNKDIVYATAIISGSGSTPIPPGTNGKIFQIGDDFIFQMGTHYIFE